MALKPFEIVSFGGVDSRSNPVAMPPNRSLRCLNWVPKQDGHLELRYGYSTEAMSTVSAVAIHTLFPYQSWDATKKYLIVGQGATLSVHSLTAHTDSPAVIRGAALASSAKWGSYYSNNRLHIGNGTDQKFFDGTTFRDNGLRAPTTAEMQNIAISEGVPELTAVQASTITLTAGAGGSFAASAFGGVLVYVALFNPSVGTLGNEIGPATILVGSGRIILTLNQKITVANMPVPAIPTLVKLIAGTTDGGGPAHFFTDTSTAVTSCSRSGVTLTVISPTHGLTTADVVILSGTTNFDSVYSVTVVDANTFTVTLCSNVLQNTTGANTTGGTCKRIVQAGHATTTVDVLAPTQDTSYQVNQPNIGLAASAVGSVDAGYQFFAAIYNPNTGHVGNRIAIGPRAKQTAYRTNFNIWNLPDLSGSDTEWQLLIGRTGDGAQVPYVLTDSAGTWLAVPNAQTLITVGPRSTLDGNFELPTRNGIIPAQCSLFARVGDYIYAADPASPTVRRSGNAADNNLGIFLGRPEQSWAGNDIETFPTAEAVTGIAEDDQELFAGTLNDCAILADQNGIPMWKGPWNVGLAGPRAMVKTKPYGFFWLSGQKQLCTFVNGMPTPVSEEYEAGTLALIGDAYLGATELTWYRDALLQKDEIRIEARKADGTPFTIIHDFRLGTAVSAYGQGYTATFQGPLATSFTETLSKDANGKTSVYVGASTGQLYQLYVGANDVGSEYAADTIFLMNAGPNRPDIPFMEWIGDGNTVVSIGKTLSTSTALGVEFGFDILNPEFGGPQSVPGAENDSHWRVYLDAPEIQSHLYLRFQLTSHSADGNLNLNDPPHVPLETYGRIYEVLPVEAASRGK